MGRIQKIIIAKNTKKSFAITYFPVLSIKNKHISLIFRTVVSIPIVDILKGINSVFEDDALGAPEAFFDG
jgi:hypothetical protein